MTLAPRPVRRPAAVIFDMDGLMLDTERLGLRAWADAVATTGMAFDMTLLPALIGRNMRDCRALIAERHGAAYPVDAMIEASRAAFEAIVAREDVAVKPGLVTLLDWLEAQGIPKAVATSTRNDRARAQLAKAGLLPRFAALVGGNEVARGKPAPDIFLAAAERLGQPPADIIVLEDSEPGVRGALAAGMTPIMVPDLVAPSPELLALEPLVVASLVEVPPVLAKLPRPVTGYR
jgi:HAD superfamily hydrolase (TIGR01509 family)